MKLFLFLSIMSLSTIAEGMLARTPSSELKQRTSKTVSSQNKLSRSTSGKLEKVGQAIKKSTSLTGFQSLLPLQNLLKVQKKNHVN